MACFFEPQRHIGTHRDVIYCNFTLCASMFLCGEIIFYTSSNTLRSNFFIFKKAFITLCPLSGSDIMAPKLAGITCQEKPNLSLHQPHMLSCPSLVKLFQ